MSWHGLPCSLLSGSGGPRLGRPLGRPRLGRLWFGLLWFGLLWFGLLWFGLLWFGLLWFGLLWFGRLRRRRLDGIRRLADCTGLSSVSRDRSLRLGVCMLRAAARPTCPVGALGSRGCHRVRLPLVRPDDHDHVAAVLLRRGFDEAKLLDVAGQALKQLEPELGP